MLSKSVFMMMVAAIFGLIMPMAAMASPTGDVAPAVEEFQADNVSPREEDSIAELHERQTSGCSNERNRCEIRAAGIIAICW
ncbi:hypothetical protein B0J12DRAFT_714906 [Macrophomina phaseolina]|uniref:Secreted protein n=1 Tax=Macrophomina phaseolina TaxID=35725 RepID=A0ABQ8FQ29_9PEZI|nr:hypothetical protein B0J12DRAFT_714906 [Macrophomina phaseolina]